MPDALRRVSIHCGLLAAGRDTIDLVLPASLTVSQLMPSIVDAVGADGAGRRDWRLALVGGPLLDESMTLVQNGIHNGDLLMLATVPVEPPRIYGLTTALAAAVPTAETRSALRSAACLSACLFGTVAVAYAGLGANGWSRVAAAAVLTVLVTAAALAGPRIGLSRPGIATLNVAAVAQAAVLGFLVVPVGPDAANFFLAAVAAASLGTILIRVTDCGTEVLLAVVTVAATVGVVTACAVLWPLRVAAHGALLGAVAMGALSLAPRLSIALAGLVPAVPDEAGESRGGDTVDVDALATRGHQILTGLVAGCSAAAAIGTMLVTVGGRHPVTAAAVAFNAAIGVALLLRCRSYASGRCRTALTVTGFCSLTAMFTLVVAWSAGHGSWTGALAVGAGLAVLSPATVTSPVAVRIVDALEYSALAVVAPLACWLTGIVDLVRNLGVL